MEVGVAYGTDIEFARTTLTDAIRNVEGVLDNKPVDALFLNFGDSALIFRLRWWIESYIDTRPMFDRVNTAIYNSLRSANILIPFPQREVRIVQESSTADLIHDVPTIIEFVSRVITLEPGDVIMTGTPGKAEDVHPGDTVDVEIEGIGVLSNPVSSE